MAPDDEILDDTAGSGGTLIGYASQSWGFAINGLTSSPHYPRRCNAKKNRVLGQGMAVGPGELSESVHQWDYGELQNRSVRNLN